MTQWEEHKTVILLVLKHSMIEKTWSVICSGLLIMYHVFCYSHVCNADLSPCHHQCFCLVAENFWCSPWTITPTPNPTQQPHTRHHTTSSTLNNKNKKMRLTSTLCFWRFSDSSVVSLETGTLGQPRLCAVTVGRTGEAGAIRFICPSTTSCRGWEGWC